MTIYFDSFRNLPPIQKSGTKSRHDLFWVHSYLNGVHFLSTCWKWLLETYLLIIFLLWLLLPLSPLNTQPLLLLFFRDFPCWDCVKYSFHFWSEVNYSIDKCWWTLNLIVSSVVILLDSVEVPITLSSIYFLISFSFFGQEIVKSFQFWLLQAKIRTQVLLMKIEFF